MRLYKASRYVDSCEHYNGLGKYVINMIVNLAFGVQQSLTVVFIITV